MATSTLGSGTLVLAGTTSGTTTVTATAVAGTTTLTLPAATDTLVGKATTDTLTNKTLTGAAMNGTLGATTPSTVAATTLTTSSTVTHNGGTANGVGYLDGSKVLTTGSALVFDGTNLGVGVTPTSYATVKAIQLNTASTLMAFTNEFNIGQNVYYNAGNKYITTGAATMYAQTTGQHQWFNAASGTAGNAITFTQAMTLDASGNLLVGTTSQLSAGKTSIQFDGATLNGTVLKTTYATTGSNFLLFLNSAGSVAGVVTQNGTTTVSYTTSSDYRLKDNVQPMTGALAKVAQLKPVTYKWKSDNVNGQGFLAHELQAVVPDCVVGEKDAVYADGSPKYQGIDTSFLVATLTAAIQEQQALITTLTARITALESA